jgi:uncharacterized membrane protein YagU involved in acid resistance
MTHAVRDLLAGAAAGTIATAPMTAAMEGIRRMLPRSEQDPLPPRQITERAAIAAGIADDMNEGEKEAATAVSHFAFGAGAGALYGLLAPHLPGGPVAAGVGYGLVVWAGSYLGWLPATGLYKQPENEPAGRHAKMILAHVVWGATLGMLHDQLAGGRRDRNGPPMPPHEVLAAARATGV